MGFCDCSMSFSALLCVHSSFAIILMGKRERERERERERDGCFALFVVLVSRECYMTLPHDATGLDFGGSDFRLYDGSDLKTYLLMRW